MALRGLDGTPFDGVLSTLALDGRPLAETLALVQALGDAGIGAPSPGRDPDRAARRRRSGGLAVVAALEHPERWGGFVDLPENRRTPPGWPPRSRPARTRSPSPAAARWRAAGAARRLLSGARLASHRHHPDHGRNRGAGRSTSPGGWRRTARSTCCS